MNEMYSKVLVLTCATSVSARVKDAASVTAARGAASHSGTVSKMAALTPKKMAHCSASVLSVLFLLLLALLLPAPSAVSARPSAPQPPPLIKRSSTRICRHSNVSLLQNDVRSTSTQRKIGGESTRRTDHSKSPTRHLRSIVVYVRHSEARDVQYSLIGTTEFTWNCDKYSSKQLITAAKF
uniref:Uncharacterized protein n=1 Tax=Globodera rostochiensis TaxID=31243 RepID=A0A914I9B0_GLORO